MEKDSNFSIVLQNGLKMSIKNYINLKKLILYINCQLIL